MRKIYVLILAVILMAGQTAAFACGAGSGPDDGSKTASSDSEE